MNIDENKDNLQPDLDTTAALADISADLFGQGEGSGDTGGEPEGQAGDKSSGEPSPDAAKAPAESSEGGKVSSPTPPSEGENSTAVQDTGAPKTWTKEALAEWASVPPRVQQEILKREEDFLKGITQYKGAAEVGQRYESVVDPYRHLLQAENIDPVQLFQSFSANHYLLSRGTPEQKVELAVQLINSYGIDFNQVIARVGSYTPPDPELTAIRQELDQLKSARQTEEQLKQQQVEAQIAAEIKAFAEDTVAHPHFMELIDDIGALMKSGLAKDLQDAYDRAVYANPATRAKELERITSEQQAAAEAEAKARMDKVSRLTGADVKTNPTPRNGTVPVGSMDDTLAETLRLIETRG